MWLGSTRACLRIIANNHELLKQFLWEFYISATKTYSIKYATLINNSCIWDSSSYSYVRQGVCDLHWFQSKHGVLLFRANDEGRFLNSQVVECGVLDYRTVLCSSVVFLAVSKRLPRWFYTVVLLDVYVSRRNTQKVTMTYRSKGVVRPTVRCHDTTIRPQRHTTTSQMAGRTQFAERLRGGRHRQVSRPYQPRWDHERAREGWRES